MLDCTLYSGEWLWDLRYRSLPADFLVVESTHTFQGKKRKLEFDVKKYPDVFYFVYDELPTNDAWENEKRTRNFMDDCIRDIGSDILMICDMDEFWNPDYDYRVDQPYSIRMKLYYYYLNLYKGEWSSALCVPFNALSDSWTLRRSGLLSMGGGWHYSYMDDASGIKKKIESFSHTELLRYADIDHIQRCIDNKVDLYGRGSFKQVKLEGPEYLMKNQEKYKEWILD